jgi:diacylglycerol kinase family enzyme
VDWRHKKKIGPLAYVIAGIKAMREKKPQITVRADGRNFSGELVLIGNGKYYGGSFGIFPLADLCDGLLEVCIFPRVDIPTLARCAPNFLMRQKLPEKIVGRFRAEKIEMVCESGAAFELDGEWAGNLPVKFSVERGRLRVIW